MRLREDEGSRENPDPEQRGAGSSCHSHENASQRAPPCSVGNACEVCTCSACLSPEGFRFLIFKHTKLTISGPHKYSISVLKNSREEANWYLGSSHPELSPGRWSWQDDVTVATPPTRTWGVSGRATESR